MRKGLHPHFVDWRVSEFVSQLRVGKPNIVSIYDLYVDEFTSLAFNFSVSAIWDWNLPVKQVSMSRVAIQQIYDAAQQIDPTVYTLESLISQGWELSARWLRCGGIDEPHWFMPGTPISVVLSDKVGSEGLAWLVQSEIPEKFPAYCRVFWNSPVPIDPEFSSKLDEVLQAHGEGNHVF